MRNPGGFLCITEPESTFESDTFSCSHCVPRRIVKVGPKERPEDVGGLCKICMGLICPRCVARGNCDPFEKKLERREARGIALRSYGL